MDNPEVTLAEYCRIIRKRYKTILAVIFPVIFSTLIFTHMQTPVYEAVLELKIERHLPMSVGETLVQGGGASSEAGSLATDIRLITSIPVIKKVVERMEVLPADSEEREAALHGLALDFRNRVMIDQISDTNILNIRTRFSDPKKAALVATAIADVYSQENIIGRRKQTEILIEYMDKQMAEYLKQLAEQENKLQKFNQNEKIFEVTPQVKETLDRLTIEGTFEFENEMLRINSELKELYALDDKNAGIFDKMMKENSGDDYIIIGLKRRLLELEFERFLHLIDYTEKHPTVLAQDKIIGDVKNKMVGILKNRFGKNMTSDLETGLAKVFKGIFLETRKEVLYRIVNKFYGDSGSLSSNQVEYLGLKRNIDRLIGSYDALSEQRDAANLNLAKVIDDVVTVVSPADPPRRPIKPNMTINFMVSCAVGLLLGLVIGFIKESIDSSIGTIHDVEQQLNLAILGIIPHIGQNYILSKVEVEPEIVDKKTALQRARLITMTNPKSWPAESYKMLRSNLIQLMKTKNLKAILFTSSDMQEGKSTTVSNIAVSMAQIGKKTILVGANMRRPTDYKIFGLNREPGLSDVLMGNVSWKEVVNTSSDILIGGLDVDELLQMPGIDNLQIISAGHAVDNISELLNSKAFDQLISELKAHFDIVIIDCSPVMAVPDAVTICDRVDGVILVYKVGHTPKEVLKMAKTNLMTARANLLGVVLNDIKTEAQVGYSAFSYRYYGEKPEKKENLLDKWKNKFKKESQPSDKSLDG